MKILMSSFVVYLLRLEQGKYYVGRTDNMENRWKAHISGKGSLWTKKYRPIELMNTYHSKNPFEEDKYTKECMAIYGIDNVRGGSYVRDTLDIDSRRLIQREIWAANDCCVRCGRNSHFVKECCFDTDIHGQIIDKLNTCPESVVYACGYCDKEFDVETDCDKHMENCEKNLSQIIPINTGKNNNGDMVNRHFFFYHLLTVPNIIGIVVNFLLMYYICFGGLGEGI